MLVFSNKNFITTLALGFGVMIGVYLLSSNGNNNEMSKIVLKKEGTVETKFTKVKEQKMVLTVINEESTVKKNKVKDECIQLKPHHLYVRSNKQIEIDIKRHKEMHSRFLQRKKSRENYMRNQQLKEQIKKVKGKENV